ncbi:hypothetical protein INR49_011957 [Caranx melampygus]|nr:hypothetical protein INR49_011957 [Caranx melampygus]
MPHSEKNRALVVSVAEFEPGVPLGRRPGPTRTPRSSTAHSANWASRCSSTRPERPGDRTAVQESRPVKDCFLAVLSSHGEEGCVFGADGKPVQLSRLFGYFSSDCMEGKSKVFLVQACRGHGLDDGVEVDSAEDEFTQSSFFQHPFVPIDTAVMYATAPGYGAFMHPLGSVFLQTFCTLLAEEGNRNLELTRLMTRLSHSVAYTFQAKGRVLGGKKEMPCLLTRLTREVFPFAEPGKRAGPRGFLRRHWSALEWPGHGRHPSVKDQTDSE